MDGFMCINKDGPYTDYEHYVADSNGMGLTVRVTIVEKAPGVELMAYLQLRGDNENGEDQFVTYQDVPLEWAMAITNHGKEDQNV